MVIKKIMRELQDVFDKIKAQVQEGNIPDPELAKRFVRLCGQLQANAPDSWAEEADDFLHLANQFYQGVKKRSEKDVVPLLDSLEDSMNFCHRTFKV